ncbi:S9 family peptidase [Archaeoglobales archaeon]|nr:MAG: S9 family peptidase [Archaeoglobales archaeon]
MENDPFIWLEELNDPKTSEFIKRHNERFKQYINDLSKKFINRIKKYYSLPYITYFRACSKGIYLIVREENRYTIKLLYWNGDIENILSSNELGKHVVISVVYPSISGDELGFFYTEAGSDEGILRIIDTISNEILDELKGSVGNIIWIDEHRYYYVRFYRKGKTPDGVEAPAERIFMRKLGGEIEELVFGYEIPTNHMIWIMEPWEYDKVFIVVQYGWNKSIIYGGLRNDPSSWKLLYKRDNILVKPIGYYNGIPYMIVYDRNGLGRIIRIIKTKIEEILGEDIYPLRKAVIVGDKIYAEYLVNASSRIKVFELNGKLIKEISFNEPVTIKIMDHYKDKVLMSVESFSSPPRILSLKKLQIKDLYTPSIKLDLDINEEWTISSNDTRIHMFIIRHKEKSNRLAIVYGYGGFGLSITPFFVGVVAPFIEDGGIFVVANLRGGGEYGEKWHKMGMRENKQNVFEDYKAVLRYVKNKGFKTIGWGISNGGLLVAATMVQSPELFDVALIGYPVIDMLRFHKLYIGRLWTTEYGDPDNPRDRAYLIRYSPYHNIKAEKQYPYTLVYTGLYDDRVHPGHALKFVARLEEVRAPVYLRVETSSGHMGSSPIIKIKEYSDLYAFIYRSLSIY